MSRSVLYLAVACILLAASARASEHVVWQIGRSGTDYAELAIAGDVGRYQSAFPQGVTFRVGQDDPAKDWPFIHPSPSDVGWAGEGTHPFTVLFRSPGTAKGRIHADHRLPSTRLENRFYRIELDPVTGGKALIIKGSAYNTPEWTSEIRTPRRREAHRLHRQEGDDG